MPVLDIPILDFLARLPAGSTYLETMARALPERIGTLTLIPNTQIRVIDNTLHLSREFQQLGSHAAVIYKTACRVAIEEEIRNVIWPIALDQTPAAIIHPLWATSANNTPRRVILVPTRYQEGFSLQSYRMSGAWRKMVVPEEAINYFDRVLASNTISDRSVPIVTYLVIGSDDELTQMLATPSYAQADRMATLFSHMFPYMREWLKTQVVTVNFTEYRAIYPDLQPTAIPDNPTSYSNYYQVATIQACLGTAYSSTKLIKAQLYRRYKAACANVETNAMTETDFNAIYNLYGTEVFLPSASILEMLGRVLAIREDLQYDLTVTTGNLASITRMQDQWQLSTYALGMLEQMRLVFAHSQHSSIMFGFHVLHLIERIFTGKGGEFARQYRSAVALQDVIETQLFVGLRRTLPENHKIKNMSLVVYTGALYAGRVAAEEGHKDTFSVFNIAGIAKHIQAAEDRQVCEAISKHLPMGGVVSLGTLARFLLIEEVELALSASPNVKKQTLYHYLRTLRVVCPWRSHFEKGQALEALNELERTQLPKVYDMLDTVKNGLVSAQQAGPPTNEGMARVMALGNSYTRAKALIMSMVDAARDNLDTNPGRTHEEITPIINHIKGLLGSAAQWDTENYGQVIRPVVPAPAIRPPGPQLPPQNDGPPQDPNE
ncbi:hypothetical protein [Hexartovirus lepeophtheiri]|uniref:Uncharacterized protein n=1 Tax=Lepeophtheirus virus LS24 TaxID=2080823 RepID=A0A3G1NGM8_9MONO|nr:hypothetical protein QKJ68_gp1 [Lepeophtheirus virus LS24]AUZ99695.1 hypothetical protein [Lepeophtheirus virus LS24]